MGEVVSVFTAEQVAKLAGVSKATLSEWSKLSLFEPDFSAKVRAGAFGRTYSFQDLVAVKTLQILRKKFKVPPLELQSTAQKLRHYAARPWSELTLYVLNREVHFKKPDAQIYSAGAILC